MRQVGNGASWTISPKEWPACGTSKSPSYICDHYPALLFVITIFCISKAKQPSHDGTDLNFTRFPLDPSFIVTWLSVTDPFGGSNRLVKRLSSRHGQVHFSLAHLISLANVIRYKAIQFRCFDFASFILESVKECYILSVGKVRFFIWGVRRHFQYYPKMFILIVKMFWSYYIEQTLQYIVHFRSLFPLIRVDLFPPTQQILTFLSFRCNWSVCFSCPVKMADTPS